MPVVANVIEGITDFWIKPHINGYLSNLNPEEFASRVLEALEISRKSMLEASSAILKQASTEIIDREYIKIIHSLSEGES